MSDLPDRLHEADIVISSTASTLPILGKGTVEHALKERRHKPVFMVDLAVPRDIEPQVGDLSDVYLYAVDDLRSVVEENLETRKAAARDAEKIIETQTGEFMRWLQCLDSVPTIRHLHQQLDALSSEEVEKATRRLNAGDDPEQVIRNLARAPQVRPQARRRPQPRRLRRPRRRRPPPLRPQARKRLTPCRSGASPT